MQNLVFLPATAPSDETYGSIPIDLPGHDVVIHKVSYPRLVWYNAKVREKAITQIRGWNLAPVILIGFSKSGLGAWNITREMPDLVRATIVFDAPVASVRPSWDIDAFYADEASWQEDLPLHTIPAFATAVPAAHRLVLVSGENFHDEMKTSSDALNDADLAHTFLPRPQLEHHWNSGWIEEALDAL